MSADRNKNDNFSKYLKYLPSKSLSLEFIKSNDGDFFYLAGEKLIFALLDGALEKCRSNIILGIYSSDQISHDFLCAEVWRTLKKDYNEKLLSSLSLINVINATGIVIHTNLGRAPLCETFSNFNHGRYSNLEFDIKTGLRGRRDDHLNFLITRLTGAEDAICVNNNAAAVMLISSALAAGGDILISRGESVEIGEGFRINEMIKTGGANVIDTGATNSCSIIDYEAAFTPETKIAARIHTSNYRIEGYTKSTQNLEFIDFCRRYGIISYFDLGSGLLKHEVIDKKEIIDDEPSAKDLIACGFDIISFSCDKLLGAPQAGIICGRKEIIASLRRHQMYRALRLSKEIIASLQAALCAYLFTDYKNTIPVLKMINDSNETISARCLSLFNEIQKFASFKQAGNLKLIEFKIADAYAAAGGGSTPGKAFISPAIHIKLGKLAPKHLTLDQISRAMRLSKQHVIGYIDSDSYILNLRTVFDNEIKMIADSINSLLIDIVSKKHIL